MAFTENMDPFFADYGIAATVAGVSVIGIFDKAYQERFGMVSGSAPALIVPSTVSSTEGDIVVVSGTTYKVASVEPDGTGLTVLVLR